MDVFIIKNSHKLTNSDLDWLVSSDDGEDLVRLDLVLQSPKLFLLRPIVERRDDNNDDDSKENGSS